MIGQACSKCGRQLLEGATFCVTCGTPTGDTGASSAGCKDRPVYPVSNRVDNMGHLLITVQGYAGRLELYEDSIRILATSAGKPKRIDIRLTQIKSVEFNRRVMSNHGYIQFLRPGEKPKTGFFRASADDNSMMFHSSEVAAFEEFKTAVQDRMAKLDKEGAFSTERVIMEANGQAGQLQLLEDRIRILRKTVGANIMHGAKGDKDILLSHISSVQFKRAGWAIGYIQFAFLGGKEAKHGSFEAWGDENTVTFNRDQQPAFEQINAAISERMGRTKETPHIKTPSNLDDLEKLASLRDKGIITEGEFQQKKNQILGL